jgi:effector-binding domain-containing protein
LKPSPGNAEGSVKLVEYSRGNDIILSVDHDALGGEDRIMNKAIGLVLVGGIVCGLALWAGQTTVKVTIQEIEPFSYACMGHKGPFSEIPDVVNQLMVAFQQLNVVPAGPMMAIFFNEPELVKPVDIYYEVGFPISEETDVSYPESVETDNKPILQKKQWTFSRVASAVHTGSYETTSETVTAMMEWIKNNGYAAAGPIVERYTDMDPATGNPGNLKTEIWIPIRDAER